MESATLAEPLHYSHLKSKRDRNSCQRTCLLLSSTEGLLSRWVFGLWSVATTTSLEALQVAPPLLQRINSQPAVPAHHRHSSSQQS